MIYTVKWEGAPPDGGRAQRKGLPNAIVAANRAQALRFLADMIDESRYMAMPRRIIITAKKKA